MKGVKDVRRQSSEPETADIKTVFAEASLPKEVGESQSRSEREKNPKWFTLRFMEMLDIKDGSVLCFSSRTLWNIGCSFFCEGTVFYQQLSAKSFSAYS